MSHPRLRLVAALSPRTVNFSSNGRGGYVSSTDVAGALHSLSGLEWDFLSFVLLGQESREDALVLRLAQSVLATEQVTWGLPFVELLGVVRYVLHRFRDCRCTSCDGTGYRGGSSHGVGCGECGGSGFAAISDTQRARFLQVFCGNELKPRAAFTWAGKLRDAEDAVVGVFADIEQRSADLLRGL